MTSHTKYKSSDNMVGGNHYKELPIPPYEYCQQNKLNCLESNVVKYVTRHKQKGGLDDLDKAIHCINLIKEWEYLETGEVTPVPNSLK